ncbi:LAME_0E08658g1_1 [Lachancea meyersii CBS 8951]|uniref:Large ribosomal subunit protein uL29m n=1 Tax=Lachancea meyersii CBS 8951 TaxID=1266667 RepID=A0A1G4JJ68_9SACH|nr:LAME_0E08658g1_1 [Lachancea meyersii CBS 8951]
MLSFKRGLHSTLVVCARTKYTKPKPKPRSRPNVRPPTQATHHSNNLNITAPIPPAVANIVTPEDHPLWQFFAEKKYMRKFDELDNDSRAWSIAELRRKSFDDLHSLWYTCLRERNILARENHLLKNDMGSNQDSYEAVAEKIRTTMWRIRHVLSERDWAFKRASQEFDSQKAQFLQEFETDFLEAPAAEDEESFEKLARLQQSVFGISEFIDENTVDRAFVDGMKYVATLKLKRFASRQDEARDLLEQSDHSIKDAGEAFVIFTAENTEAAAKEACDVVKELRAKNSSVSRYEELETVSNYVKQLAAAQMEKTISTGV